MMLEHTDKQYEKELAELKSAILKMGGMVEQMVGASMRSLIEKDTRIGEMAVEQEPHVNQLEMDIDARCLSILALRQPAAYDLRFILTGIKISKDLERMGDLAINIRSEAKKLNEQAPLKPYVDLPKMSGLAQSMVKQSLDAFVTQDTELAKTVLAMDDGVDDLKYKIQQDLIEVMSKDPSTIERAMGLLAIARHVERVGDIATNIAELVVFLVEGKDIRHQGKHQP